MRARQCGGDRICCPIAVHIRRLSLSFSWLDYPCCNLQHQDGVIGPDFAIAICIAFDDPLSLWIVYTYLKIKIISTIQVIPPLQFSRDVDSVLVLPVQVSIAISEQAAIVYQYCAHFAIAIFLVASNSPAWMV